MLVNNKIDQSTLMSNDGLRKEIEKTIYLSDQEFAFVLDHFQKRHFKKHQIVLHEGDLAQQEYFVLDGLMRVSKLDSTRKEHILQFGMENQWIMTAKAITINQQLL